MSKILVVDDDVALCKVVRDALIRDKYVVEIVHTGGDAASRLRSCSYDLVILDWGLPDVSGVDVLEEYRARKGAATILMLTGRSEIREKETGLDAGADDYLTKPFDIRELTARARALLRRPTQVKESSIRCRDIVLDRVSRRVTKGGKEVTLLPKEFNLLEFLLLHPRQVFSQESLIERVWNSESGTSPDILRVYVTRLRKKLDDPDKQSLIRTVYGVGYELNEDPK